MAKLRIPKNLPAHYKDVWRDVVQTLPGIERSDEIMLVELCRVWYMKQISTAHYNKAVIDEDFARAKHFQGVMENSHRDSMKLIQYFTDRARKEAVGDGVSGLDNMMDI